MSSRKPFLIVAMATFALTNLGSTCTTPKNPSTMTPPTVTIKVKGADGQYAPAGPNMNLSSSTTSLDLMCIVADPAGVKSLDLSFGFSGNSCTLGGGGVYSGGGFQQTPPLPATLHQDLQGQPGGGNVLNELPMLATIHGPFACSFAGGIPAPGTGQPLGDSIVVTCTGTNWSTTPAAAQATGTLNLTLQ